MSKVEEIWKDIKGYKGLYQISNLGRIKSLGRTIKRDKKGEMRIEEKIIQVHTLKNGYNKVDLFKEGKKKCCYIHRLVAEAFIPNTDRKKDVNHINGIKLDNRVENLEWATRSENMKHAFRTGLSATTEAQRIAARKNGSKNITQTYPKIMKKVKQYDLEGNFIKEWKSITDAEEHLNINLKHMAEHCRGKRKSLGGYIWRYSDDT